MKKQTQYLFPALTALFAAFVLGFLIGRNLNHEVIQISVLPDQPRHDISPTEVLPTQTAAVEISFPIDLNTAGVETLTALPGIGEGLAQRILDYRAAHGPFVRPEELLNVDGIGEKKLEALLDYVITGG